MSKTLDRWLAPWVFVLTGILFNILSAVITHYFIGLNNDAIADINREIDRKQVLIDSMEQYSETELEILESRASQDEWLRKLKVLGEIGVLQGRTAP